MMIAARNAFLMGGGKPWANPYITDGLVAMWDGEWNAGGGVHDASATTWADLSGNGYDLAAPNNYQWRENCCDMAAKNKFTGSAQILSEATTEFVGCFTEPYVSTTNTDMGVEFGGRGIGTAFLTQIINSSNDVVVVCRASVSSGNATYRQIGPYPADARTRYVNQPTAFSCYGLVNAGSNFSAARISVDGVARSGSAGTYWTSGSTVPLDSITVGSTGNTAIRLFCVRLYSRALTAAEVAANYALDATRFGL